ncbi:MAG: magnesium/cobalt transporter CorA [Candidatus Firestonebacteria bacterium]
MSKLLVFTQDKVFEEIENVKAEDLQKYLSDKNNILWLDIENSSEKDIDMLIDIFNFHSLSIEDVIFPHNYPKIETFEDYLFLIIHAVNYNEEEQTKIISQEINIYFGENYIVSVHEESIKYIHSVIQRAKSNPMIMSKGTDFLLHLILDGITDSFFPVLDIINDKIDKIEDKILIGNSGQKVIMSEMLDLKRNLLNLRKIVGPLRNVYSTLTRSDLPFIRTKTIIYFRDVYDHMLRIFDLIEAYRELLSATMEADFTIISTRLNEIMKTLTIIATFMMPLTLITSFYGMNVKAPEFEWGIFGYIFVWIIIILATVGMFLYFKKKKWF